MIFFPFPDPTILLVSIRVYRSLLNLPCCTMQRLKNVAFTDLGSGVETVSIKIVILIWLRIHFSVLDLDP